jgi:hypothetical protein
MNPNANSRLFGATFCLVMRSVINAPTPLSAPAPAPFVVLSS